MTKQQLHFWLGLFTFVLVMRVLPYVLAQVGMPLSPSFTWYPWNFSPMLASCLFAGACLSDRRWAYTAPLVVFAVSNFLMWAITQDFDFAFSPSQPLIAACFAGVTWLGTTFSKAPQWRWALPAGVLAEGVFFLVTNFAVWALVEGTPYPPTLGGLWLCYVAAIPFIGKSLVSTVIFTSVFFSPWVLSLAGVAVSQSRPSLTGAQAE